jgi:hypothetical protein
MDYRSHPPNIDAQYSVTFYLLSFRTIFVIIVKASNYFSTIFLLECK